MKSYFVYILTNHDNSVLYIGITNDLPRRLYEHKHHLNPDSFTSKYRLYKLIWYQEFLTAEEAILVEKKIKKWRREKKDLLIEKMNPSWQDLGALR